MTYKAKLGGSTVSLTTRHSVYRTERTMANTSSEFEALKARLKATWMAGDFGQIAM